MPSMLEAVVLVPGDAAGPLLVLDDPLSFWGGVDPDTGLIIDGHHPDRGRSVAGTVLVMPSGRGSSSSSSVLAEALRLGTGPAALVLFDRDVILALGSMVAEELYGRGCPVVMIDAAAALPAAGTSVTIDDDGVLRW